MGHRKQEAMPVWKRMIEDRRARRRSRRVEAYVAVLEDAVLYGEHLLADLDAMRRKGYSPRPLFDAADAIRARRRGAGE